MSSRRVVAGGGGGVGVVVVVVDGVGVVVGVVVGGVVVVVAVAVAVVMVGGVAVAVGCGCGLMEILPFLVCLGDAAGHVTMVGTCCPSLRFKPWTGSSVVKRVLIVTAKGREFESARRQMFFVPN